MSWTDYAPDLLTLAVSSEIEKRHSLPFTGSSNDNPEFSLSVVEDMHLGGLAIDLPTRIVLAGWANALEKDRPTVDKEVADAELDFWAQYDMAKDNFMSHILNRVLPLSPKFRGRLPDRSVDVIYHNIIRQAQFHDQLASETPEVTKAKQLLFSTDENGDQVESEDYLEFLTLGDAYLEAEIELESAPDDISPAKRSLLKRKRDRALTRFNVQGRRAEFEHAEQILNQFSKRDNAESYRTELLDRFEATMLDSLAETGRRYPSTRISNPGFLTQDVDQTGWHHVKISGEKLHGLPQTAKSAIANLAIDAQDLKKATENAHAVKAAYRIVDIQRNWMDFSLFSKGNWGYSEPVSDAKGGGSLPAIPDGLIVMPYFEVTELICDVENIASRENNATTIRKKNHAQPPKAAQSMVARAAAKSISHGSVKRSAPPGFEKMFNAMVKKKGLTVDLKPQLAQIQPHQSRQDLKMMKQFHKNPQIFMKRAKLNPAFLTAAATAGNPTTKTASKTAQTQATSGQFHSKSKSTQAPVAAKFRGGVKLANLKKVKKAKSSNLPFSANAKKVSTARHATTRISTPITTNNARMFKAQAFHIGKFKNPIKFGKKPPSKVSCEMTIALHDEADIADIDIRIERLANGKVTGSPNFVKSPTDLRHEILCEKSLVQGDYQLRVMFRENEVYCENFTLKSKQSAPKFELEVTVAEQAVLSLNGTDPDNDQEEDAYLVPIFGYRARRLPACPNANSDHDTPSA